MGDQIPSAPFNTNGFVWVRLNEWGWKIFDDYHLRLGLDPARYRAHLAQPPAWQRFHLWELMHIFGPEMCMGRGVPFDQNVIRFTDPASEESHHPDKGQVAP